MGIRKLINLTKELPFAARTPLISFWLQNPKYYRNNWYYFRKGLSRLMRLIWMRQFYLWRDSISPKTKNILWLSATSHIGDALMRLSAAQLIENQVIDLGAKPSVVSLFQASNVFRQCYDFANNPAQLKQQSYDLIILDSINSNNLRLKKHFFPATPFVTLHEMLAFRDDYNFIYFSWHRMAYLLREIRECGDVEKRARLELSINKQAQQHAEALPIQHNAIGIVIGGRENYRIYHAWLQVIASLLQHYPQQQIVLLGSDNGLPMRDAVMQQFSSSNRILDCVGKYQLMETAAIIARCQLIICADGGLLHIANALNVPVVALFANVLPEFRCTQDIIKSVIYTDNAVDDIAPQDIVAKVIALRSSQ